MLGAVRPAWCATSVNFASNGRPERWARCCGRTLRVAMPCAKSDGALARLSDCRMALRVIPVFNDRPGSRVLLDLAATRARACLPIAGRAFPGEAAPQC